MKIGVLQLNFTVGDVDGNFEKLVKNYQKACAQGADLVVASELALFGYPPQDLLERQEFIQAHDRAFKRLQTEIGEAGLVAGVSLPNTGIGKRLFNAAVLIQQGQVLHAWRKALLPTYDVFDEARYFEPGTESAFVFELNGVNVAMLVCEDIWGGAELLENPNLYERDVVSELKSHNPDVLIVPNGSPYYFGKGHDRLALVQRVARQLGTTVVFVNQTGGNTELVFDGRSFVVSAGGDCIGALPAFESAVEVIDLDTTQTVPSNVERGWGDLYQALVLGVRDYANKTGHRQAVVGLSGGIDSAVTACIAVAALGAKSVTGLLMPSGFSSEHSVADAQQLASNLKMNSHLLPISQAYKQFERVLAPTIGWHEPGTVKGDVTEENVQARIRGVLLMAFANRHPDTLPLTTGNKSEVAMGYCTLYGDMAGGYAVLADVWKTWVYALAEWINESGEVIPKNTICKPPSAELRPHQKDSDSLPPYEVLDAVLVAYLEERHTPDEIVKRRIADAETVKKIVQTVHRNEFKRRQMPPGLKVTSKAFGSGRRMPIAVKLSNV